MEYGPAVIPFLGAQQKLGVALTLRFQQHFNSTL